MPSRSEQAQSNEMSRCAYAGPGSSFVHVRHTGYHVKRCGKARVGNINQIMTSQGAMAFGLKGKGACLCKVTWIISSFLPQRQHRDTVPCHDCPIRTQSNTFGIIHPTNPTNGPLPFKFLDDSPPPISPPNIRTTMNSPPTPVNARPTRPDFTPSADLLEASLYDCMQNQAEATPEADFDDSRQEDHKYRCELNRAKLPPKEAIHCRQQIQMLSYWMCEGSWLQDLLNANLDTNDNVKDWKKLVTGLRSLLTSLGLSLPEIESRRQVGIDNQQYWLIEATQYDDTSTRLETSWRTRQFSRRPRRISKKLPGQLPPRGAASLTADRVSNRTRSKTRPALRRNGRLPPQRSTAALGG